MKRHAACALVALALLAAPVFAQAPAQAPTEENELNAALTLDTPAESAKAIRAFIAKHPESKLLPAARFVLARALLVSEAPSKEIVDEAKLAFTAAPALDPNIIQARVELLYHIVVLLRDRKEQLDGARDLVKTMADGIPADPRADGLRQVLRLLDASIASTQGKRDEAISIVRAVVAEDPDNQAAQLSLAEELEKAGRADEAIDAYVRAETVFTGDKIDGAPLRALYQKKNGSLAGLDAKLAEARSASVKRIALDDRRVEMPAPDWELKDLAGASVKLSGLKGQVVVLDFWATWCPPCRVELPHIEALHGEYAGKNVRVIAVNCEGADDVESWEKLVKSFVTRNKFTFTVVNDFQLALNESYQITALPTVVVIDKTGTIRYVNRGFSPAIPEILRAQIDSLSN